jgi:transposase InsO family protein
MIHGTAIKVASAAFLVQSKQSKQQYPLCRSAILDCACSIHICNDLSRFHNFRKVQKEFVQAGSSLVPILGYGNVDINTTHKGSTRILRLRNVAFCTDFVTTLVSYRQLRNKGYFWDSKYDYLRRSSDDSILCSLKDIDSQWVIEYKPPLQSRSAFAAFTTRRLSRKTSRDPRPAASGDADLWHRRMGHIGPMALLKLGTQTLGVRLKGPSTAQCSQCAVAKIKRQVSRRPPNRKIDTPGQEIHVDWTDLAETYDGYVRIMFMTDACSGQVTPYFMSTHGQEKENLRALKDYIQWLEKKEGRKVKTVRSDNELFTKRTRQWLRNRSISCEPSAPRTQDQNGRAERSGGVIMVKARAMIGNLPHHLWKEIVNTAVYLHNRTPKERLNWKSPYELYYTSCGPQALAKKPQLAHLKAFGCRAYAMTPEAQLKKNRLRKLDPRAHIGYLVGYDSTNIYRIWIPEKGKVISTRDVIFDESLVFVGKDEPRRLKLTEPELDDLIGQIELPQQQTENEKLLEEDEEIFDPSIEAEDSDDEQVVDLTEGDYELAHTLENALLTPPPSECPDSPFAGYVQWQGPEGVIPTSKNHQDTADKDTDTLIAADNTSRFEDFSHTPIKSTFHGVFEAGRRFRVHKKHLPPPPKSIRELSNHPYRSQFEEAQKVHLESHRQMGSFQETSRKHTKGQPILGCMWVFIYKTDKHGFLQKCKARLVVWGHQQPPNDLPTRATTLASTAFRALMGITAKFDLETRQIDAVNAFVNCPLDEVVYMKMPPGFEKQKTVFRLKKALYGLRRSPLLWQTELTKGFREMGFKEIPQEPCVMMKGGVIVFFYVDDIVFCYQKKDVGMANAAIESLQRRFSIVDLGELKWFLGIHILRDRTKKCLWLSQAAYIDKIASKYGVNLAEKPPLTPMAETELLPSDHIASKASIRLYQQMTGSLLFAAITTRPDCSFAVSRLARFNQNPSDKHHQAANRVIQYLYHTRSIALRFGPNSGMRTFICASDASFADNSMDRKSSQGYLMMLFGGAIAWKANKQDTVTTSTTEAELLALSQTAKEAIFLSRLLKALNLRLDTPLTIDCDNKQTLRLVTEESAKLATKLRHVDIHQHWLRQEFARKHINVQWVPTRDMMADGFTKALGKEKHQTFTRMMNLEDIGDRISRELRQDELKEQIQKARIGVQGVEDELVRYR